MKFTNGFWLLREGVSLSKGVEVQSIRANGASAEALVATRRVAHRGQTLNIGTMNVRLSTPAPDCIRVNVSHHKGGKTPIRFDVTELPTAPSIALDSKALTFASGALQATLQASGDFNLEFSARGKVFASQGDKGIFYATNDEGKFIGAQLPIGVGEQLYGFGNRGKIGFAGRYIAF